MLKNRAVATIILIQITEVLGFSLILPFLPLYAQKLGANPLQIGLILTSFSLFQFISAPIMGKLSDIYGRKNLLILSQFSTFISFIILAFAKSLPMIYLSRITDGLLGSNMTITQAYLSDISKKNERSKVFALSGIAFGVGFMIGPAIGGLLSQINFAIPALLAAGMSAVSMIATQLLLKETIHNQQKIKFKLSLKLFTPANFQKYFQNKLIAPQLWIFFAYVSAHVLFSSNFSLFINKKLDLNTKEIGFALAYIGAMMVILRGLVIPKLLDIFKEEKIKNVGMLCLIAGLFLLMIVNQKWMLYPVLSIFAFGSGLTRPLLMGAISKNVNQNEQGVVMGITNSLGSIAQIFAPILGGFLLKEFLPFAVLIPAFLLMLVGFILNLKTQKINQ